MAVKKGTKSRKSSTTKAKSPKTSPPRPDMHLYAASTLHEYIKVVCKISGGMDGDCWFRGHSSATHQLVPSALRNLETLTDGYGRPVKRGTPIRSSAALLGGVSPEAMFDDFKQKALPLLRRVPENNFEWMAIMQHYGVPTRMLDWTENALVALYFATENAVNGKKDEDIPETGELSPRETFLSGDTSNSQGAAVFAMDPAELNRVSILRVGKPIYLFDEPDEWDHYFDPMRKSEVNDHPIAVHAATIDDRIRFQSGHFTIHGRMVNPIESYAPIRPLLHKIFIPHESAPLMLKQLSRLGVTKNFIYPSLDSLAFDTKVKFQGLWDRSRAKRVR